MRKRIVVILLGGTIACKVKPDGSGYDVVSLSDFVSGFKELDQFDIVVDEFRQLSGVETRMSDIIDVCNEVKSVIGQGADGVVVIQGTNLLEEVSFAIDILNNKTDVPVVCTGAMRPATAVSADGPANLINAVMVAGDDMSRGQGTLVVLNNEIYSAQTVRKEHTMSLGAFHSDFMLGYIFENKPVYRSRAIRRALPDINVSSESQKTPVLIYTTFADDDAPLLDHIISDGYKGLVIEGTGAGGIPSWIRSKVVELNKEIPVVLASRIGRGNLTYNTYGRGFQQEFFEQGICMTNILDSRKSRILLTMLLMAGFDRNEIFDIFKLYTQFV